MLRSVRVDGMTTEKRIGDKVGVEGGLELVGQISPRDSLKNVPACIGHAGVARQPAPAALFDHIYDSHCHPFCPFQQ